MRGADTSPSATIHVTFVAVPPTIASVTPDEGPAAGGTILTITGDNFVSGATTVTVGGAAAPVIVVIDSRTLSVTAPAGPEGTATVAVATPAGTASLPGGYTYALYRRYFAEGATGGPLAFETSFALLNPDPDRAAAVTLRFLTGTGEEVVLGLTIPPESRRTIAASAVAGLERAEFSTVVESDLPIVADRSMAWGDTAYGSHAETSLEAPSTVWYLAEGATHSGFDLFYLLQNPHAWTVRATVTYLRPAPAAPLVKEYELQPNSRFNIWVDLEDPDLRQTDVSARIEADAPVIVERAMYWSHGGATFHAGHNSAAVPAPANTWFFAEGATGAFFDLFILIANPGDAKAEVVATYLLPDGTSFTRGYDVAPSSRTNIWVDLEDARLRDTAVSISIASANGVPVIAERAMWWFGPPPSAWIEAHNAFGATATGRRWALAEGEQGGPRDARTYILIANTSAVAGQVRVRLLFEDGSPPAERTFDILPSSRFNVDPGAEFPAMFPNGAHRRFAAIVESVGPAPAEIVVERAIYTDAAGIMWAAGTSALATRLP
jgi:hypothetical protein